MKSQERQRSYLHQRSTPPPPTTTTAGPGLVKKQKQLNPQDLRFLGNSTTNSSIHASKALALRVASNSISSASASGSPNSSLTLVNESSSSHTNTNSTVNVSVSGKIIKKNNQFLRHGHNSNNNDHGHLNSSSSHGFGHHDMHQYSSIYDSSPVMTTGHSAAMTSTMLGETLRSRVSCTASASTEVQEFLPVCDALFNVISLAIYFCDIVFDVLTAYSFYNEGHYEWTIICLSFIICSLVLSQFLSYKLYRINAKKRLQDSNCVDEKNSSLISSSGSTLLLLTHFFGLAVLWRYFKLFIPLDMKLVKNKVRDLLLLRLVHGFIESAPMLIIQLYLILLKKTSNEITDLNIVSTILSLLSLVWALASFSKNIRQSNVHKLMLTWLGIIFQFGWRIGTISCRILALTLYATVYSYWLLLLVLGLHWFSMFIWILSPHFQLVFLNETVSNTKKYIYSVLIAFVYVFCYVNVLEQNEEDQNRSSNRKLNYITKAHNSSSTSSLWTSAKIKMTIYYVTMFLENVLLVSVWYIAIVYEDIESQPWYFKNYSKYTVFLVVVVTFCCGMFFMGLYYRYFHVKRLSYSFETTTMSGNFSSIHRNTSGGGGSNNEGESKSSSLMNGHFEIQQQKEPLDNNNLGKYYYETVTMTNASNNSNLHGGPIQQQQKSNNTRPDLKSQMTGITGKPNNISNNGYNPANNIQGVFNCRFNPAMKRKKKKPTPFVIKASNPIGIPNEINSSPIQRTLENNCHPIPPNAQLRKTKMSHPFWKKPLGENIANNESNESQNRSVEIHQKLLEKKQQQLANLLKIEEEIKFQQENSRLAATTAAGIRTPRQNYSSVQLPPPPYEKKQPLIPPHLPRPPAPAPATRQNIPSSSSGRRNSKELLLNPNYLDEQQSHENGVGHYNCFDAEEQSQSDWSYNFDCSLDDDLYSRVKYEDDFVEDLPPFEQHQAQIDKGYYHPPRSKNYGSRHLGRRKAQAPAYKSCRRIPSDIESQLSLARSYTLPREFKYRRKLTKILRNEQNSHTTTLPSTNTNSSDGDVDSGAEDEAEIYGHLQKIPLPVPSVHHLHIPNNCQQNKSSSKRSQHTNNSSGSSSRNSNSSKTHHNNNKSPKRLQQQQQRQPVHETKL